MIGNTTTANHGVERTHAPVLARVRENLDQRWTEREANEGGHSDHLLRSVRSPPRYINPTQPTNHGVRQRSPPVYDYHDYHCQLLLWLSPWPSSSRS